MSPESHYCIDIYLPHPILHSSLLHTLIQQWSTVFGGTTAFSTQGTYLSDASEQVTILRVYVSSSKYKKDNVLKYFTDRKNELQRANPDQAAFLVTFSENHYFL